MPLEAIVVALRFVAQTAADVVDGQDPVGFGKMLDDRSVVKGPSRVAVDRDDAGIPCGSAVARSRIEIVHPKRLGFCACVAQGCIELKVVRLERVEPFPVRIG